MPERHLHSCAAGGCSAAVPAGQAFCDSCAALHKEIRNQPEHIAKLYNSRRWKDPVKGTSALVRAKNPLCQFLDDFGVQCQHASEVCHHLCDPKDNAAIFWEWSNLVAVCAAHHQGGQQGETQGYKYCHTIGFMGTVYKRGFLFPCWHEKYVPMAPKNLLLHEISTTAVGAAAIAKALSEPI
jgi:hypothetical protein